MSDNLPLPARPAQPLSPAPVNAAPVGPTPFGLLLTRARTDATRRTYANNLKWFFRDVYASEPDPETVRRFLSQTQPEMVMQLAVYRQQMKDGGASGATMNLRLTAVRSLVTLAHEFRFCDFDGSGLVYSAKAVAYRDTRGPGLANVLRLLDLPDRRTLRGKRDFALMRLLADNALRRCEIGRLCVADFEPSPGRLAVLGKGQDEREWVTLHPDTIVAIQEYLAAAGHKGGALFRNCAFRASAQGAPLTDDGLYHIVRHYGKQIGVKLSPHKFRHFAITAALEQTNGNVSTVRKFSRHKRVDTVMIYDDNRSDQQGEVTMLLGNLLSGKGKK